MESSREPRQGAERASWHGETIVVMQVVEEGRGGVGGGGDREGGRGREGRGERRRREEGGGMTRAGVGWC